MSEHVFKLVFAAAFSYCIVDCVFLQYAVDEGFDCTDKTGHVLLCVMQPKKLRYMTFLFHLHNFLGC